MEPLELDDAGKARKNKISGQESRQEQKALQVQGGPNTDWQTNRVSGREPAQDFFLNMKSGLVRVKRNEES